MHKSINKNKPNQPSHLENACQRGERMNIGWEREGVQKRKDPPEWRNDENLL